MDRLLVANLMFSYTPFHLPPFWRSSRNAADVEGWRSKQAGPTFGSSNGEGCRASSQGFGGQSARKSKRYNGTPRSDVKQSLAKQLEKASAEPKSQEENTETLSNDNAIAPILVVASNVQQNKDEAVGSFEERLEVIKRSAQEKKRQEQEKIYGPIDYDAPAPKPDLKAVSFPVKIGIGLGVVVFGLIFAFGDLLPSGELNVQKTNVASMKETSAKESSKLKEQLQGFEAILKIHPDDLAALEGAAVTYAELGDFSKSETALQLLLERRPVDVDALRLLGEVQNALGKFDESAVTYRQAIKVSPKSITLLKGLVEALVHQGKPNEAVEELIAQRDCVRSSEQDVSDNEDKGDEADKVTSVQIGLLLGKTYAEWGHSSDAVAVYDSIIKAYPEDFHGYLAKAILLKEQGQKGEAERMFIQARYFASEKLKPLVDRYSKQ